MKNLAGDNDCDLDIERELTRCKIEIVRADEPRKSEVAARLTGKLGPFTFKRAWYYWVVEGPMPLGWAKVLYADPVGRTDVRASGYAGGTDPTEWAERNKGGGRALVVRSYHIDTEIGLRLFADTARAA